MSVLDVIEVKVADEVFIATALLHRENPKRSDFLIGEIVARAAVEDLAGELRAGVRVHASLHCVANRAPNPGKYAMLFETGKNRRRLLLASDPVHPERTGKVFPDPGDVPERYHELIDWARHRYGTEEPKSRPVQWLSGVFEMFGLGKNLWSDEDPDEYIRKQREGWD
ncbi:MAG: hypothetical protein R2762_16260 [Bryobacteraceae bacterium]